jgi:hypothetical protein
VCVRGGVQVSHRGPWCDTGFEVLHVLCSCVGAAPLQCTWLPLGLAQAQCFERFGRKGGGWRATRGVGVFTAPQVVDPKLLDGQECLVVCCAAVQ